MKCEITVYEKVDKALHPLPGAQYIATLHDISRHVAFQAGGSSPRVAAMRVVVKAVDAGFLP